MEPARVLSFDGTGALRCAPNPKERLRQMIHEEVDHWVDELLVLYEEEREPTLEEISELLLLPFSFAGALTGLLTAIALVLYSRIGIKEAPTMGSCALNLYVHGFSPTGEKP